MVKQVLLFSARFDPRVKIHVYNVEGYSYVLVLIFCLYGLITQEINDCVQRRLSVAEMKGRRVFTLTTFLLLFSVSLNLGLNQVKVGVKASNGYPVHNLDTCLNYTSIQDAIDAPETHNDHTIFVESGIYTERLFVNKSVQLFGEDMSSTIINGNGEGNIVEVRAGNVVLANFSITNSSAYGVVLETHHESSLNDCTLHHNNITDTYGAIKVRGSTPYEPSNISITENIIANNTCGILFYTGENSTISTNTIVFNELGMLLTGENNNMSSNILEGNFFGLEVGGKNNKLRHNKMNNNQFNFIPRVYPIIPTSQMPENDIDTSNRINGKSIYYIINQTDLIFDSSTSPEVGFLGLKYSRNITIRNLTLTNNGAGILLVESINSTIEKCTLKSNMIGFSADTNNTSLKNCTLSGNYHGVSLFGFANNLTGNEISNNTVRHAPYRFPENWYHGIDLRNFLEQLDYLTEYSGGILLFDANNCTITGNNIRANEHGILIYSCSFNTFKNNTMTNNAYNFGIYASMYALTPPEWSVYPPDPPQISPYLLNEIDTSNTVNGKPIYYWISRNNETVPANAGYVALVNCSSILVQNLTLTDNYHGVFLIWVNNIMVTNNTISHTRYAVDIRDQYLDASFENTIKGNNLTSNGIGVNTIFTANCTIMDNVIASNLFGVYARSFNFIANNEIVNHTQPSREEWILGLYPPHFNNDWLRSWRTGEVIPDGIGGIFLLDEYNMVKHNNIRNNSVGLILGSHECQSGAENTIHANNFIRNTYGILLLSPNNTLFHNNFIDNSQHVKFNAHLFNPPDYFSNCWRSNAEGNYWDNYNGTDINSDGIGDMNYTYAWIIDSYPLMGRFSDFLLTSDRHIQTICNSTISDFQFNGTAVSFDVSGENGTTGFCRLCIPTALMNETYRVFVNGTNVSYNLLPVSNSTHSYIYFTYDHSTKEVVIVPEFPSLIILPLFMTITLFMAMIYRKYSGRKVSNF